MGYWLLYAINCNIDISSNNCIFVCPWGLFNSLYFLCVLILKVRQKYGTQTFYNNFQLPPSHPGSISIIQQLTKALFPFSVRQMTPLVQTQEELISQQVEVMLIATPGTSHLAKQQCLSLPRMNVAASPHVFQGVGSVKTQMCSHSVLLQSRVKCATVTRAQKKNKKKLHLYSGFWGWFGLNCIII